MPPPPSKRNDQESDTTTSEESSPAIARRGKFDDEEEDSDVLDSWDAAEDSEAERAKLKKIAEAKAKADAASAAQKKSKAQRIEERRVAAMRSKADDADESSSDEEDPMTARLRAREREQDSDLQHAQDLIGSVNVNKTRSETVTVVMTDPTNPESAVDLAILPLFNPVTKDQFVRLRETLVPLLAANASKVQYTLFIQEFSKQIVKDLPSDQIKKISSGLATLSNEKMKEEKSAEKGGKKSKAATSKARLVASRDVSIRADTTSYADIDDDDFM